MAEELPLARRMLGGMPDRDDAWDWAFDYRQLLFRSFTLLSRVAPPLHIVKTREASDPRSRLLPSTQQHLTADVIIRAPARAPQMLVFRTESIGHAGTERGDNETDWCQVVPIRSTVWASDT